VELPVEKAAILTGHGARTNALRLYLRRIDALPLGQKVCVDIERKIIKKYKKKEWNCDVTTLQDN
jgi:hypothetical protein